MCLKAIKNRSIEAIVSAKNMAKVYSAAVGVFVFFLFNLDYCNSVPNNNNDNKAYNVDGLQHTEFVSIDAIQKNKANTENKDPMILSDGITSEIDKPENNTQNELTKHNVTEVKKDFHLYYNSTVTIDKDFIGEYWDKYKNITAIASLSRTYRRAVTIQLSFDFPFYGHPVRNVTVATGGFLHTGDYVHSWLAATQYIAPLMANFDTSLSNDSYIKSVDSGTSFTVLWEKVLLQDNPTVGAFTFATTLHKNGDIVFTYFAIPIEIQAIKDKKHPVKVGVSDAYITEGYVFFVQRKTIYEYHKINFNTSYIQNDTIIYLSAQRTCPMFTDGATSGSTVATPNCSLAQE